MRYLGAGIAEYEIGCLETDRVSFYARVGWEAWRGALTGRKGRELLPTPDQKGIMILRLPRTLLLDPVLDLDGSLTIECDWHHSSDFVILFKARWDIRLHVKTSDTLPRLTYE